MLWHELVDVAIRRRSLIQGTTLIGSVLFALLALVREPSYTASATLLVGPRVAETPVSSEANSTAVVDYRHIEAQVNSTVTMLTSPKLVEEALRRNEETFPSVSAEDGFLQRIGYVVRLIMGFPNFVYERLHGVPEVSDTEQKVGSILKNLVVKPVDAADLIEVSYTGSEPAWSAGFVNALVATYLSPAARRGDGGASLKFFQEQRTVIEKSFRDAQAALRAFRETHAGALGIEEEQELRAIRLKLEDAKAAAETELSAVTAQVESLSSEQSNMQETLPVRAQVAESTQVSSLRARVMELELQRNLLATKFAPGSVAMSDIEMQVTLARQLLNAEVANATAALRSSGAGMEQLTMNIVAARTRKAELAARVKTLTEQIDDYTLRLDRHDAVSAEYEQLEAHRDAARTAFLNYTQKEEEARFASALDDSSVMNVVLAAPAAVPVLPDPSAIWLIIVFGMLLSFGAGIGLGVVRDMLDHTVKSTLDAEQAAGLPVLSVLWVDGEWPASGRGHGRQTAGPSGTSA
jgi:uncharacterized protein involved in exopolysaccharide biosynthesis